jgi:prepilin signal peptidase PulO-like enzyme (type II secretory pathway)
MTAEIATSLACGLAAWVGSLMGRALCSRYVPFEDGPPPVAVRPSVMAFAGVCIGIGVSLHHLSCAQLATTVLVVFVLAAVTVSDFALGIVPDMFTLIPLAGVVVPAAFARNYAPLLSGMLVALPFAIAAIASHGRGMGWGDVKTTALGAALLGPQEALLAFMLASAGAVVASRFPKLRGRPIAFAPYLAGGIGAMLAFGSRL